MGTKTEIIDLLTIWGIHRGFDAQRSKLADALRDARTDFTEDACRALFAEAVERRKAQNPAALVAKWLEDGSWENLIAEIRSSASHMRDAMTPPDRNMMERKQLNDRDESVTVFYRVVHDNIPVDQIAKDRGESAAMIRKRIATVAKARDMDTGCPALRRALDPEFASNLDQIHKMFGESKHQPDPMEDL